LKVAELVPNVAIIVALCAALTAAAVNEKVALLAFAATAALAGTTTAESLLDRLIVPPLLPIAELSVIEQLSVPPPVIVALVQLSAVTVGCVGGGFVTAVVPVPLNATVMLPDVALLTTDSVPAAEPAAAGANWTLRVRVSPPARLMGSALWLVREKAWPATLIWVTCTASTLAFFMETVAVAVCPTVTFPNEREAVDATSVPRVVAFGAMLPQPESPRVRMQTAAARQGAQEPQYFLKGERPVRR
jgi:hypothetical protein